MMKDKSSRSSEDTKIIKVITTKGRKIAEIIAKFQYDDSEFLAVKLSEDSSDSQVDSTDQNYLSVAELCHFNVNGSCYLIIRQVTDQHTQELNPSLLLTSRELQIATLVALGCPNKQIADKLHISEWTVATYLRRIFLKLGVDTRAAMAFRCASIIGKQNSSAK